MDGQLGVTDVLALPDEIVKHILSYLTEPADYRSCRLSCSRFGTESRNERELRRLRWEPRRPRMVYTIIYAFEREEPRISGVYRSRADAEAALPRIQRKLWREYNLIGVDYEPTPEEVAADLDEYYPTTITESTLY